MHRHLQGGAKEWLLLAAGAVLLLAALLFPLRFALADESEEARLVDAYQRGEIIRIHVIANSNSPEDQQLKLEVRDALINAFGDLLAQAGSQSSDAVYDLLCRNVSSMQHIAADCASANGFHGAVQAEAGRLYLPAKTYGSVTLPSGEYRALRVTIGEGQGENWWCVLYPQLCLALSESEDEQPARWMSRRIFSQWLLMSH